MATEESCLPGAQLMESMRAVGYSIETAVADIIDNSISAGATSIEINFSMDIETPYLSIFDDGVGMSAASARNAMRLAGVGANSIREDRDLGRFGLGLKTASLSQCRRLTVITKQSGKITGLVWDLDHMIDRDDWSLIVLDDAEMEVIPNFTKLESVQSGTLVVWTKLDRIHSQTKNVSAEFDQQMIHARDHLALIFHQFLNADHPYQKVEISINSMQLDGLDPFLTNAKGTQKSPVEKIVVQGIPIDVQAFTLPYLNKMSEKQRALAQVPGQLRDSQGFYIYRGGRLVIWGTWFKLLHKSENGKLARVKVDIPNSLDHLWSLDIKKSTAIPPVEVRDRLRRFAQDLIAPSERTIVYRGRKEKAQDDVVRLWDVVVDRDTYRYEINREHPLLQAVQEGLGQRELRNLENALEMIELLFPAQDLVNRFSKDHVPSHESTDDLIRNQLIAMWETGQGKLGTPTEFVDLIIDIEPWNAFRGTQEVLINWIMESGFSGIEGTNV